MRSSSTRAGRSCTGSSSTCTTCPPRSSASPALAAIAYGAIELVEGTGLWLDKLWAEFLTVISTSLLLPYELYELVHRPTVWKAGGIVVNIAIVAYLVVMLRRRLRARAA